MTIADRLSPADPSVENVGVIGLGYVGLPLAVALGLKGFPVTAFDIDHRRIDALRRGIDRTGEVDPDDLQRAGLRFTSTPADLAGVSFFIIAVPTPIDANRCPDLEPLRAACVTAGEQLSPGAVVVVESTVYPGTTEEVCAPVIERASGLRAGIDFKLGYSPERINPGDSAHGIGQVIKVVAGQDAPTLERVAALYESVVGAGVHRAPSIAVAETAKAIENTQRDLNIALMNELAKICHLLDIRTSDVLAAAGTKWNFLPFRPGLVGGHCIGVDPYYLAAKAQRLDYHPEVILAGRRINSGMGAYVADQLIRLLVKAERRVDHARIGILGLTFKENVPDLRNSAVFDIVKALRGYGVDIMLNDPLADGDRVEAMCGIAPDEMSQMDNLDALILAVPHRAYDALCPGAIRRMLARPGIFFDVRGRFPASAFADDIHYWSL